MAAKTIDFYFDFLSPFSYLANTQLPKLTKRYGYAVAYHPIDIPQAKIAAGNYGPSNREIPAKIKVLLADLERWAKKYNVPFAFPKILQVEPWNVGTLYATERGDVDQYVERAYAVIWGQGVDPTDTAELRKVADSLGWDTDEFMTYVESASARSAYRKGCVEAHRRGVFGAPIMMIGDQAWWGNDRLMFLEDYLQEHPAG